MKILSILFALSCTLAHAEDWPQWRGPDRDGISTESGLLKQWPEGGPKVVWEVDTVGVGYSAVAVADGRIYTQGDLNGVEHVICLDEKTGNRLWAVQVGDTAKALQQQVDEVMKSVDRDGSGVIEETEALQRFGFDFNKSDPAADPEQSSHAGIASDRADRLVKALDQDKNGRLSLEETGSDWSRVFGSIDRRDRNADKEALAAKRAEAYLARLDADKDGKLDRKEIRASALKALASKIDQKDPDSRKGDGLLTRDELIRYLSKTEGGKDGELTHGELCGYYLENHPGKDGILSLEEARNALHHKFGGYRNGQGDGPRGTPTVHKGRLYVEGGNGDVACLDRETGGTLWHINLAQLGGRRPGWGYSESPAIYQDMLYVTPGGSEGTLAALDLETGELRWQCKETTQGAHYASPRVATIAGIQTVVQFGRESAFGVHARNGKLLWEYKNAANGTANCSDPVVFDNHVFAASAYGTGGGLAKIYGAGGEMKAEEVYFEKSMQNHHGGMVKVGDYLYGFGSGGLICLHYLSGKVAWTDRSVGKGSLIAADGMLYLLGERHEMALAEANPEGYREHGRFPVEQRGRPSWAHPVIANGRLYIRNQQALTAYEIRK